MGDAGAARFPGNLDPQAQEFRPNHLLNAHPPLTLYAPPPPSVYYSYASPPYYEPSVLAYPQYSSQPAYVSVNPLSTAVSGGNIAYPPVPPPSAAATRTLVLSLVPREASESLIRKELEVFGEVRGVQMERIRDGIVTVHFYDLRQAEKALKEVREQHMQQQSRLRNHYASLSGQNSGAGENWNVPQPPPARGLIAGRAVWAQFGIPACNAVPGGNNQGTVVVFNLVEDVSNLSLKKIFEAFGPVKELRETPMKKHQKFVEFYDVRDAAKALTEMNRKEINGTPVVIEFSRPGGYSRKFFNATSYPPSPPPPPRKFPAAKVFTHFPHSPTSKRSKFSPNPSGNKCCSSIEVSMAALSLDGVEDREANGHSRRHGTKNGGGGGDNGYSSGRSVVASARQQVKGARPWKGKQGKKLDNRYLINEDAINESNCRDGRTTVMIKNIPNKYSQKLLLNMLDNHCIHCNEQIAEGDDQPLSAYDFVYLPIDFNNKCNVGYGFVNMTSPEAALRLHKAFHHQHWEVFNSRKICEVTYARVQGLEALKEHFKNSKFPCEMEHYLPVVFSPPRDGKQLSDPTPIAGQRQPNQPADVETDGHDWREGGDHPADDSQQNDVDADEYDAGGCAGAGAGERCEVERD